MPKSLSVTDAKLIRSHEYILKKLATSNTKTRKKILENAPQALFTVLHLIFRLIQNNQLDFTKKHKTKIKKHRRIIRSTSKLDHKSIKGKLIRQEGGSLKSILSTVLPIIGTVVKAFI